MNLLELLGYFNYWVFAIILTVGLYAVISKTNLIKKLIGLSIFQSAVFLMYITMDKVEGGTAPIIQAGVEDQIFSNPLVTLCLMPWHYESSTNPHPFNHFQLICFLVTSN
jgi:multicomponent Na+:H+ antiporter subunit C